MRQAFKMRGFRGPDVEAGRQQVKSPQKKLSDVHGELPTLLAHTF